jgi:hypothetical protein
LTGVGLALGRLAAVRPDTVDGEPESGNCRNGDIDIGRPRLGFAVVVDHPVADDHRLIVAACDAGIGLGGG